MGTLQSSLSEQRMEYYLDEYTFRFNRRTSASRRKLFYRLVEQAAEIKPVIYNEIKKRGVKFLKNIAIILVRGKKSI